MSPKDISGTAFLSKFFGLCLIFYFILSFSEPGYQKNKELVNLCNGEENYKCLKKLIDDAKILRPTCMCGVPKIFQRVYDAINDKLKKQPTIVKKIFKAAIDLKMKDYYDNEEITNVSNKFNKSNKMTDYYRNDKNQISSSSESTITIKDKNKDRLL